MTDNDNQGGNQDTGTARDECPNHHSAVNGKCKVGWCPYSK
jgi:hypothetical protein